MNKSKHDYEWWDYTWNPISGCAPISAGCDNCYAAAVSERFNLPWGKPVFHPERLDQPGKLRKSARIFVCSMSDIGHDDIEWHWYRDIWTVMEYNQQHTFMMLTKRPERLAKIRPYLLPNVWIGVTAENQAMANERIPVLFQIPAAVRFVSVEPMLGPVDLAGGLYYTGDTRPTRCEKLDWVIAGPETGPKARPCDHYEFTDMAAQCEQAGVPFWDKRHVAPLRREWPHKRNGDCPKGTPSSFDACPYCGSTADPVRCRVDGELYCVNCGEAL